MKVHFKKIWEDIKRFGKKTSNKISSKFNEYVELKEEEKEDEHIIVLMDKPVDGDLETPEALATEESNEVLKELYIETEVDADKEVSVTVEVIKEELYNKCPYCGSEDYKNLNMGTDPEKMEHTELYLCKSCDNTYLVIFEDNKIKEIKKSDNVILG